MDRNAYLKLSIAERVGQARKSLWIETAVLVGVIGVLPGQARKSLWIET